MTLDPFLYVALAGGYVAGRVGRVRSPWVGHAATASVGALLFLLGVELGGRPLADLLAAVPIGIVFAVATLGATVALFAVLPAAREPGSPVAGSADLDLRVPLGFALLVLGGLAVGRSTGVNPGSLTEFVLYVLLALVGFEVTLAPERLRGAWRPLLAAVVGGFAVAAVFAVAGVVPLSVAFATASAFGWYSLAGPLVTAQVGATFGTFAFLANFLRENLTMLTAPWLGRRLGGPGVAAAGGATSMDTTLYFVTRYGSAESATVGLATGLTLTVAAAILVPGLLSFL